MTKKNPRRLQVDDSPTGSVMPCPLCSQRVMSDNPLDAWKMLYRHLRGHHDHRRAAELTQHVRKRIARINWENRQKESTPPA